MLPIHHDPKLFFRIRLENRAFHAAEAREIIDQINASWTDIEYLNYLLHKNFSALHGDAEADLTFSSLIVFSDSFYFYLSTIVVLLKQLAKSDPRIRKLVSANRKFLDKRIQIIRNNVLVHKEKTDFIRPQTTISCTDPDHLVERSIYFTNSSGKMESKTLRPLEDIEHMHTLLQNLEQILNGVHTR